MKHKLLPIIEGPTQNKDEKDQMMELSEIKEE